MSKLLANHFYRTNKSWYHRKKRGCGIILGDTIGRQPILIDAAGVESYKTVIQTLLYAKEK
jgi:hypothetical protein